MDKLVKDFEEIVRECGKILVDARDKNKQSSDKAGSGNIVTIYDKKAQDFLKEHLLKALPEAVFVGEEEDDHKEVLKEGYTFIVDPIDGTYNFSKNYDQSAISVGLLKDAEPYIGVCYNPYGDEMFTAQKGCGAYLNGEPIHVSDKKLCEGVFMAGSAPYYRELRDETARVFTNLYRIANDFRRSGSAVLDICAVACGRFEAFFEVRLQPWDYTGAEIIVTEAGGYAGDMEGKKLQHDVQTSVLITNGAEDYLPYIRGERKEEA